MIGFACHVCRTALTAEESQAGKLLRCPTCLTVLRAPLPAGVTASAATATVAPSPPRPEHASSEVAGSIIPDSKGAAAEGPSLNDAVTSDTLSGAASNSRSVGSLSSGSTATLQAVAAPLRTAPPAPAPSAIAPDLTRGISRAPTARRYGFNCAYCSSRLEATGAMAAQEGQCPTCGNTITIPILDRHGRLIDPITRQIIKQDPHPVHAYAAAGDRAPAILRSGDGQHLIRCPRCQATSPIVANNCKACGMPFTMEGTTQEAAGTSNGFSTASLVLGIIGLVTFCAVIAPVLAIIFGIIGYNQASKGGAEGMGGGKGVAVAGMICGGVGCLLALYFLTK